MPEDFDEPEDEPEELDSFDPEYDGAKGRFFLRCIFGREFCHEMMADFDLPTCHAEVDWDIETNKWRWMHFCVAFIPVYLQDGAEMVKEFPEHAEGHALMCVYYEAAQVGLREALRYSDPDMFALYHPGDAMPEWMRDEDSETGAHPNAGEIPLFENMREWLISARTWNIPGGNGEYEWRLGPLFWPNFEHFEMPNYDLPPRYDLIDWSDPRQTRNWLRFCLWFFPIVVTKAQNPRNSLPPAAFEQMMATFTGLVKTLDAYIPRESDEEPLFEA